MNNQQHTTEPWIAGDDEDSDYYLVGPHDGDGIVYQPVVKLHSEANARRIVACVNACAGIPTENLESVLDLGDTLSDRFSMLKTEIDSLQSELNIAARQRDELLAALDVIIPALESRASGDSYLSSDQFNAVRKCRYIKSDAKGGAL